jgi:hypothetical protein
VGGSADRRRVGVGEGGRADGGGRGGRSVSRAAARRRPARLVAPLVYRCEVCERRLAPVRLARGATWTPQGLAMRGRRRFKSVLCWSCYRKAGAG